MIPAEEGGDDYYLNGGYVKLRDAGKFADAGQASTAQDLPAEEPDEEEPADSEESQEGQSDSENRQSESMPKKRERRTIR